MNIYLENGYLNIKKIFDIDVPFIFILGARGIGKTYGVIKTAIENKKIFMLMRRTQTQCDLISKEQFSPLKSPLSDMGKDFKSVPIAKQCCAIYLKDGDEVENVPFAYTASLSTFANLRGFDGSDVDLLFYDEFIPEKHERILKSEGEAFLNCYETVNRNRELKGSKPLKCICCSNSNSVDNPIFLELGIVTTVMRMKERGNMMYINKERGICVINCENSPISKQKEETALYKLAMKDSQFTKMAIGNEFASDRPSRIVSKPIKEYKIIVKVGELSIYKHKSRSEYYVTTHTSGCPKDVYSATDTDLLRFRRKYAYLWIAYIKNLTIFEEYINEILFNKYFN